MEILILKTGASGDVLRTNFIAQGLKDKYGPKTFISWITSDGSFALLKNNPFIDELILEKNKEKVLRKRFDIVINLEEDLENAEFATKLDSTEKMGFVLKNGKVAPTKTAKAWFDMSLLGKKPQNDILKQKNKKTHNHLISEIVGLDPDKYEPFLKWDSRREGFMKSFMKKNKLKSSDKIIGINVGSSSRWRKELPVDKTIDLIEKLYKELKVKILLFGGPNEAERNKKILSQVSCPVIDTGLNNSTEEYVALMNICKLVVATDTLGLHISLALKRKTIALIGPTTTSEIGMYNLGVKLNPDSDCLCCFKQDCKSMEMMDVSKIIVEAKKLLNEKVVFLITSFKEPHTIGTAIEHALDQTTTHPYEILVSAPDKETIDVVKKYERKYKNVKLFKDPGKGKALALNLVFETVDADIIILSDGDVFVNKVTIEKILQAFEDPLVGCLTGRPVTREGRETKYGYWANFLFDAAYKMRKESYDRGAFLECSGYLFSFRKRHITKIPVHTAEDTIIPYRFWEKNFKIAYVQEAKVSVKNVDNWKEWISQKIRTSKGHETIDFYANTRVTKREKTFSNEIKRGVFHIFSYPKNFLEAWWTFELIVARLYMWLRVHFETKVMSKHHKDGWESPESTK